MQSLISVLIPAYNHEKYVQETIKSIIAQTYNNIELIVIDDGSKDSTFNKITQLKTQCENRFARFIAQTQENQGTCRTLNKLLELAQGEYIYIIASDDKASPDALAELQSFLSQNNDYALAVGENLLIDANSKQFYITSDMKMIYDPKYAECKSFTDFLMKSKKGIVDFFSDQFGSYETLLEGNYVPNGYLIRKSIFDEIGNFDVNVPLEDYYLMLQIAKYSKMKYISKPTFYYRWHGENTAKDKSKLVQMATFTRLNELKILLKNNDIKHLMIFQNCVCPSAEQQEKVNI